MLRGIAVGVLKLSYKGLYVGKKLTVKMLVPFWRLTHLVINSYKQCKKNKKPTDKLPPNNDLDDYLKTTNNDLVEVEKWDLNYIFYQEFSYEKTYLQEKIIKKQENMDCFNAMKFVLKKRLASGSVIDFLCTFGLLLKGPDIVVFAISLFITPSLLISVPVGVTKAFCYLSCLNALLETSIIINKDMLFLMDSKKSTIFEEVANSNLEQAKIKLLKLEHDIFDLLLLEKMLWDRDDYFHGPCRKLLEITHMQSTSEIRQHKDSVISGLLTKKGCLNENINKLILSYYGGYQYENTPSGISYQMREKELGLIQECQFSLEPPKEDNIEREKRGLR